MASIKDLIASASPDTAAASRPILQEARAGHLKYHPSPENWQDEILYFLLPDRFSDTKNRPLLTREEIGRLRKTLSRPDWSWRQWADSGRLWQGGTLPGIAKRLGYLQDLGVSAIWVGPVLKQRAHLNTYHGYGIQDFLDVDPRFGSREELLALVQAAHRKGIRVILDIIVNHTGDAWGYLPPGEPLDKCRNEPPYRAWPGYYGSPGSYDTHGWQIAWRDVRQDALSTDPKEIESRDQALWPREFQDEARFTRAGAGSLGSGDPADPHAQFRRSDFFALKDLALDVPPTLDFLIDCYRYWIAISDVDGYRVDTVKHMELETARNFAGAIREFAETLGKRNFLIISEIAGGEGYQDLYLDHMSILGRNMTAALDIGSARMILTGVGKGLQPGRDYFAGFDPFDDGFGSHRNNGGRHVSILDDHDHVSGEKVRFSAEVPDEYGVKDYQVVVPTAIQLFTLGIPCIYYGTEQAFAGPAQSQVEHLSSEGWKNGANGGDRYLREAMFGPEHPRASFERPIDEQLSKQNASLPGFGPFGTCGKHCFDKSSPSFVRIAALCKLRSEHLTLRVGRQYQRALRLPNRWFELPAQGELVAWSRILDTLEYLCVVNPHATQSRGGDVVVDGSLCPPGTVFEVLANTAHTAAGKAYAASHPVGSTLQVVGRRYPYEPAYLEIRGVPPCEVVVLAKRL
ncbi:MAG: alpha-amylase family glycosyl hydrolase [Phycisphaerales bacterium]